MSSRLPTVLYTHGGGRFGNQLLRHAHWLAWALEHEGTVGLVNLAFWPYAHAFETWGRFPGCAYPLPRGWLDMLARLRALVPDGFRRRADWRVQRWTARLAQRLPGAVAAEAPNAAKMIDLANPEFTEAVRSRSITVCSGWRFSGWPLLQRHEARVRALLAPDPAAAARAAARLGQWRRGNEVLVGVFLRGTDYQEWRGGRYCYSTGRYAAWMRETAAQLAPRRVRFVVTSDEPRDASEFAGLSWVFSTGSAGQCGGWLDSFLELAGCDHVLSPPSTFTACAAWLGHGSLWALRSADQALNGSQQLAHPLFSGHCDSVFGDAIM